jgi:general secretion pathway protein D
MMLAVSAAPVAAKEVAGAESAAQPCVAESSLRNVVIAAARRLDKKLLIDPRLGPCMALSQPVDVQRITYRELQALLALHGFVDTIEAEGVISIVPEAVARQLPLRLIEDGSSEIGEFEMVMKIIDAAPLRAENLVPILRPLLPQYAHLVADVQTNSLLMVGRYGSVRSLEAMIRKLRQRPLVAAADEDRTATGAQRGK